jgi:2-hydroxychromene-2-carboxylate isomerase
LLSGKTEEAFRSAIFDGLWHEQKDVADPAVLKDILGRAGSDLSLFGAG